MSKFQKKEITKICEQNSHTPILKQNHLKDSCKNTRNQSFKKHIHVILGIDPGTLITGYGIIKTDLQSYTPLDFGCIRPHKKLSLYTRYALIYEGLEHLLDQYTVEAVSIET